MIAEDRPWAFALCRWKKRGSSGLRKLPPKQTGDLRLIDITDFDLTACGGTHVRATGQIGSILLRKIEKVKQGVRVEFVCGLRAVNTARRDYTTLTESAALYSSHIYDVPEQVRKSLAESQSRRQGATQAAGRAGGAFRRTPAGADRRFAAGSHRIFPDRDAVFIKLLAQKLTAGKNACHRPAGFRRRPAHAGLCPDSWPEIQHGPAYERCHGAAWRPRRRLGRHGPGWIAGGHRYMENIEALLQQAAAALKAAQQ